MNEENAVAMRIYLEFSNALLRGFHAVLRFIGCVLNESMVNVDSTMNKDHFLENCDFSFVQHNVDNRAIVAHYVNFAIVVFAIKNQPRYCDWH